MTVTPTATISWGAGWTQAAATVAGAAEFSELSIDGQPIDVTTGFVDAADSVIPEEVIGDLTNMDIPAAALLRRKFGETGDVVSATLGSAGTFFRRGKDVVKGLLVADGDKGNPGGTAGDPGRTTSRNKLGALLAKRGVPQDAIDMAQRAVATGGGKRLGGELVAKGVTTPDVVAEALAEQWDLTSVRSIDGLQVPDGMVKKIPRRIVAMHRAVPVNVDYDTKYLEIALSDPLAMVDVMKDIGALMPGFRIVAVVAPESEVDSAIERYWGREETVEDALKDLSPEDLALLHQPGTIDIDRLTELAGDETNRKLVNLLIIEAFRAGASDIHIIPTAKNVVVQFRIDGILYDRRTLPKDVHEGIVARIKVMSAPIKIEERRVPQSGRIGIVFGKKPLDLRVETGPTQHGENVVLRLLDPSSLQVDLTRLGFEGTQLDQFRKAISMPNGIVLVTGPTGSGKTTTLYSALGTLIGKGSIRTIEDPVEYSVDGLIQTQVDESAGATWQSILRSFLRQDPDVIMVGEIRDFQVAEVAITAALVGRLVFSTLHTNDAPSAIARLVNTMAIDRSLLSDTIRLVTAQRLLRTICPHCIEAVEIPAETFAQHGGDVGGADTVTVHRGRGCPHCNHSGYKGRTAIHEVMPMWADLADFLTRGEIDANRIRDVAVRLGMRTLRQVGLQRVLDGKTTLQEVLRVTSSPKFGE